MSFDQWPVEVLGDLCETITKGSSPKWQGFKYVEEPGILFVTSENVGENQMLFRKTKYVEEAFNEKDSRSILKRGDVLTNLVGASIGRTAIFDRDDIANINQAVGILRCKPDVLFNEYLAYLLNSPVFKEIMHDNEVNNARANLSLTFFKKLQIPLPEVAEQKRIVSILDEAFSAIAKAKENAEKNLLGARELFESYLNRVFTQQGPDWQERPLESVCEFSSGGTPSKKSEKFWGGDIPWVSGRDMKSTRITDTTLHITKRALEESSSAKLAAVGDLLVLVRGMGLAHGAQIGELAVPATFNQDIRALKASDELVPQYLLFALRTRINLSDNVLSNAAHGTLKINSDELKAVRIPIPSLLEQEQIVSTIDGLSDSTRKLETIYTQKLANLDELKQSLLQKAFTGQLSGDAVAV